MHPITQTGHELRFGLTFAGPRLSEGGGQFRNLVLESVERLALGSLAQRSRVDPLTRLVDRAQPQRLRQPGQAVWYSLQSFGSRRDSVTQRFPIFLEQRPQRVGRTAAQLLAQRRNGRFLPQSQQRIAGALYIERRNAFFAVNDVLAGVSRATFVVRSALRRTHISCTILIRLNSK